ncbi:MAG: polysaccharide biosynthesis tyrosine autokinase [Bryobacteraceae bacterium]
MAAGAWEMEPDSSLPARVNNRLARPATQPDMPWAAQQAASEASHLFLYWQMIRRRRAAVAILAVIGGVFGVLYTLPQTPIYRARASMEVQGLNENFLNFRDINPNSSNSYPELDILTQVGILESDTLRTRVIEKMKTQPDGPSQLPVNRWAAWRKALRLDNGKPLTRHQLVSITAGGLSVRSSGTTRLVELFCDSPDPALAAEFTNTLATEFIDQNLESRWKSAQYTSQWLTRQLEELKIKLEKSEDELQAYANATSLIFTGERDKENVAEEKLRQLQSELLRAQADRISKQSREELAAANPPDMLPDALADESVRTYQERIMDLRRSMAELSTSVTPAHYKWKSLQAQVNELEAGLRKQRAAIASRIHNEFVSAQRREQLLAEDYKTQSKLVTDQSSKAIHYNILKREVETNRQLYESVLQKVKEAGIASAMRTSSVRVIDTAKAPMVPYKPNRTRSGMMGVIGGALIGIVIAICLERMNRKIRQPGDTPAYLGVPELGAIPSSRLDKSGLALALAKKGAPEDALETITFDRRHSLLAESFRASLTSLLFSGAQASPHRTIVVTSPNASEGKTTVICNLAIALAEINRRVLLIDADMRRPRLHKVFDVNNSRGLADVLRATREGPLDFFMIQDTGIPGLFLLPSGQCEVNSASLLHSKSMREMLRLFRDKFDVILIDTPPMLHLSDARIVGQIVDGVVLVLRSGKTTMQEAVSASQRFLEDGSPILGTILNDWNPKMSGYDGYETYKNYYSSYYTSKKQ